MHRITISVAVLRLWNQSVDIHVQQHSRWNYNRVYYLSKGAISVRVRKTTFPHTFGISNGCVDQALKAKVKNNGSPPMDEHGHHEPANKTKEHDLVRVKQTIEAFQNTVRISYVRTTQTDNTFHQT